MTHPAPSGATANYFPGFDWLRLTLAMMVALSHDNAPLGHNAADFAVQVFFALSGWLIGGILLNSRREDLPRFYFNRAARIWIPYYFAVALLFGLSFVRDPVGASWFEYLFYDITYTHNWFISPRIGEIAKDLPLEGTNNHFWSLSVEEQFYLVAPLLIIFTRWGRSPFAWGVIAIAAIAANFWYGSIALGVLAVILHHRVKDWHLRPEARAAILGVLVVCVGIYLANHELYRFVAPFASVAIVLLLAKPGAKSRIGAFAGGISYPLYLNHWIGIFATHEVLERAAFIGEAGSIVLGGVLNLLVASLFFVAIDEQVRKRRSALFSPQLGKAAAVVAYTLVIVGAIGGLGLAVARG
ncbi:MAG: acyltransferase [Pseudomonadota bacterium]